MRNKYVLIQLLSIFNLQISKWNTFLKESIIISTVEAIHYDTLRYRLYTYTFYEKTNSYTKKKK